MMRAMIKGWHSADVDLDAPAIADPENFCFLLEFQAGPEGHKGADRFCVTVCSPAWIQASFSDTVFYPRHHLIARDFNLPAIKSFIQRHVESTWGSEWSEVARKIGEFAHWEFDAYEEAR